MFQERTQTASRVRGQLEFSRGRWSSTIRSDRCLSVSYIRQTAPRFLRRHRIESAMRCLLVSLALSFAALASPEAKLSDPLNDPGWQHFYNNEFSEALASFEEEARSHPDDPDAYNHVAQA